MPLEQRSARRLGRVWRSGLAAVDVIENVGIFENMPYTVLRYAPKDVIARGAVSLARSRFDLNFDGKVDTVYRVGFGSCLPLDGGPNQRLMNSYHVIDPADPELVLGSRNRPVSNAFWFKGRIYVTGPLFSGFFLETQSYSTKFGTLHPQDVCQFVQESVE